MQPSATGLPPAETTPSRAGSAVQNAALVDSVLMALMSVGRLMRQRVEGDDLEPATFWLLKTLSVRPMRVTELASSTNLDTSTVSRHVAQLDRAGLIERTPDPDDRRAHRVELSLQGRSRLDDAFCHRRALLSRGLRDWDTDDVAYLDRLLSRFVGDVENLTTDLEKE